MQNLDKFRIKCSTPLLRLIRKTILFIIRCMDTRDFSRERKCTTTKCVSTERIQEKCVFFVFLPVFRQKVLSAKIPFQNMRHTDGVMIF